jgi:hypothetical protein
VSKASTRTSTVTTVGLLALGWFVLALMLDVAGVFAPPVGTPPAAIGVAAAAPPLVVLALLAGSSRFRTWARSGDLPLLTALQSWRVVGLAFLALAAVGALPATFAVPAGTGDLLIGLTAPLVAIALVRGTFGRAAYLGWTAFGILDLVAAVSLGVLHSDSRLGLLAHGTDTAVMSHLPMSLIPTFIVPFLLTSHLLSLAALGPRLGRPAGARTAPSASLTAAGS